MDQAWHLQPATSLNGWFIFTQPHQSKSISKGFWSWSFIEPDKNSSQGIHFVPLVRLGDGDMGRKANNLPARHWRHGQVWFLVKLKVVSCHPSMKSANISYCRQSKHSAVVEDHRGSTSLAEPANLGMPWWFFCESQACSKEEGQGGGVTPGFILSSSNFLFCILSH